MAIPGIATPMLIGGGKGLAFIGATSAQAITATTSISTPSGAASGDLLVAIMSANTTNLTWSAPGWTSQLADTTHACGVNVLTRTHDGTTNSWTFTPSSTNWTYTGLLLAFRGAAYDTVGSVVSAATTTGPVASAITLSKANSVVIGAYAAHSDRNTFSTPSGMTLAAQINNLSSGVNINSVAFYKAGMPAGSSGTFQSYGSGSGNMDGVLIGIKPL